MGSRPAAGELARARTEPASRNRKLDLFPPVSSLFPSWAAKLLNERPAGGKASEEFGYYDKGKATTGMFSRSKRGSGAESAVNELKDDPFAARGFYCSNFVVERYELTCEVTGNAPVIDVDYRKVTPKILQANLRGDSNWAYVRNYTV